MYVFIGGAYNGKTAYVKNWLAEREEEGQWLTAQELMTQALPLTDKTLVISRLDEWIAATEINDQEAIQQLETVIENYQTVFILTDVGRGLVPLEPSLRQLRDTCGRVYQYVLREAKGVTRIWYGIGQQLKKGDNK